LRYSSPPISNPPVRFKDLMVPGWIKTSWSLTHWFLITSVILQYKRGVVWCFWLVVRSHDRRKVFLYLSYRPYAWKNLGKYPNKNNCLVLFSFSKEGIPPLKMNMVGVKNTKLYQEWSTVKVRILLIIANGYRPLTSWLKCYNGNKIFGYYII